MDRRISFVPQTTTTDCGVACLAMVLDYFGKHTALDELRKLLSVGPGGVDAEALIAAGRRHGLNGRGVLVDIDELPLLPTASILHWRHTHFVVLERQDGSEVEIVDPAVGRQRLPIAEFSEAFTGVALTFEPV